MTRDPREVPGEQPVSEKDIEAAWDCVHTESSKEEAALRLFTLARRLLAERDRATESAEKWGSEYGDVLVQRDEARRLHDEHCRGIWKDQPCKASWR